jgi:hypothetical protein
MRTGRSQFEKDFVAVTERFPKLSFYHSKKSNAWVISGELDICDIAGVYWETFLIRVVVPVAYPYCVPVTSEVSTKIPRDIDWHMSRNGTCCVDIDHRLLSMASRGIKIVDYMSTKVYPFFANQVYRLERQVYAGDEYAHYFNGVRQFYLKDLHLNTEQAFALLGNLLSKNRAGRNDLCPCGSNRKFKHCHDEAAQLLLSIGITQLQKDYTGFKLLQTSP